MSYVLTPFLVDLEKVRKAVGSRDESLIAAVIESNPDRFRVSEEEDAGQVSRSLALRQLVMGEELDPASAGQYGVALELLCGHLGKEILPGAWGGVSWLALEATGIDDVLTKSGPPVPLPPMPVFPTIGHMTAQEAAAKAPEVDDALSTEDDEDLLELLEEYKGWLGEAASQKKDVVFFYR
jgi:hypothetical protein